MRDVMSREEDNNLSSVVRYDADLSEFENQYRPSTLYN